MTDGDILLALGSHDAEIRRAQKALDELPEKAAILQLRRRLKEIEALRAKADTVCRALDAETSRHQDEAASVSDKAAAEQSKVLSGEITNPKELQNLTREIAALERRRESLEREALASMEKAEAAREKLAAIDTTLAEGAEKERALIKRFKERGGDLQREIERLKAERALLLGKLPTQLADRYEAAVAAKHGIGVGELAAGLCTACRTQLPADRAQAIASGPEVAECPNCRRILVVRVERAS